jgi:fructose-bisphosphate aldolase / 2-amino-3,7-dideoxy-D-threo-hept-6-ulosonate synthase
MKRRMHRLLREDGRILIVAMDHTSFMDQTVEGLARYGETCRSVVPAGADAFLSPIGSIIAFGDAIGPAAAVASMDTSPPFLEVAIERALSVGADAVKSMAYPFTNDDSLRNASRLAADAARYGVPYIIEPIPGGFAATDMHTPEKIAAGARIAAETGADIVKTLYTGDPETMRKVVEYAMVPVVMLGGAKKGSVRDLYQDVFDAVIVAGCAGVAIGNNIWRDPDPAGITRGLAAIIHGDASVDEALEASGQLVAS